MRGPEAIKLIQKNEKISQLKSYTQAQLIGAARRQWCTAPVSKTGRDADHHVECLTFEETEQSLAQAKSMTQQLAAMSFSCALLKPKKRST